MIFALIVQYIFWHTNLYLLLIVFFPFVHSCWGGKTSTSCMSLRERWTLQGRFQRQFGMCMWTWFQWLLLRGSCQTIAYAILLTIKSSLAFHDRNFAYIRCAAILYRQEETFVSSAFYILFQVVFIVNLHDAEVICLRLLISKR